MAVWAFVALAGLTMLPLPFTGDQALYSMFGRRLAHGAVLYRDIWDVKQPGIFWFNGVAGTLFGFNEVGSHLLEVLWWIGGAALAVRAWRGQLEHRLAVVVVPLLTTGLLLASGRTIDIGQVEHLVGLPILASWWLLQRADPTTTRGKGRLVAAGVAAALVGLFKHLYLVVPAAFVILALVRLARRSTRRQATTAGLCFTAGFVVAVLPAAIQVAVTGQLSRVWWTYTGATAQMRSLDPPPVSRLVKSLGHAGIVYLPLLVLAAIGWRRAWKPARRAATVDMLVWIGGGGLTLMVQLWWTYQQLLVLVPLGLLAAHGVDALADVGWRRAGVGLRVAAAAVVVTGLVAVAPLGSRLPLLARHGLAWSTADRRALRIDEEPAEAAAVATAQLFRLPDAKAGAVMVIGNPIHQLRSGRLQAGAVHGWSAEFNTPALWAEVAEAMAAPTTAYVGVDVEHARYLARSPATEAVLAQRFRKLSEVGGLVWYERIAP